MSTKRQSEFDTIQWQWDVTPAPILFVTPPIPDQSVNPMSKLEQCTNLSSIGCPSLTNMSIFDQSVANLPTQCQSSTNPPSIECEIHGVVLSNPMLGDGQSVWQLDWTFGDVRVNFRRGCFALALDWRSSGWIYVWVTVDWCNLQCEEMRERVG